MMFTNELQHMLNECPTPCRYKLDSDTLLLWLVRGRNQLTLFLYASRRKEKKSGGIYTQVNHALKVPCKCT